MAQVEASAAMAAGEGPAAAMRRLIMEPGASASRICAFLDGLPEPERIAASRGIGPKHQRQLWKLVDGFAELSLADMVPVGHPPLAPVPHYGRNTLPIHTLFEKRFYRYQAADGSEAMGGANFQSWMGFTGPGYYAVREDTTRHEVLVDYTALPEQAPEGWPPIVPNERGVSRFIYGFMVDTCRRVSEHVSIGRANRHGKDMPAWFTLCRPEAP